MKRIIAFFTACFIFSMSGPLMALDSKIAYIDSQKILYESQAGKEAYKQLSAMKEQRAAELEKKQEKLKTMNEQLQAKSATMSAAARDDQDDLKRKEMEFLKPFSKDLDEIIKAYSEKNGIDIVLDKQNPAIVYAAPKIDITSQIITAFDKRNQEKKGKTK